MFTYEVACVVELIFNINTTALPKWTFFFLPKTTLPMSLQT